jgi:hypothetical protein
MKRTGVLAVLLLWDLYRLEAFVSQLPQGSTTATTTPVWFPTSFSRHRGPLEASPRGASSDPNPGSFNNNNYRHSRRRGRESSISQGRGGVTGFRNTNNNNSPYAYFSETEREQRRAWLEQATNRLIETKPGTLNRGKWHELASMLHAWSKHVKDGTNNHMVPMYMERILKRLLDERRAGNEEAKVDIGMYNILLDAWACAALFPQPRSTAATTPSSFSSSSWASSPASTPATGSSRQIASQRAREILVLLQETYEAKEQQQHEDANANRVASLQPNEESFRVVFYVVCKIEGAQIARRVLAWMEYLSKVGKNVHAKPKRGQYITLLDSYANSRDDNAGQLAEGFLRHMTKTGVPPDTTCYNIAIKAWTRAKRGRESAEHADQILSDMTAPKDIVTYSSVISAWAASGMKSHAVARAEELLRAIEDTPGLEANTVVLNTVMSTWTKSRNPGAVNRTAELLDYMEQQSASASSAKSDPTVPKPDLISYNTHIHALSLHAANYPSYAPRAQQLLESLDERYKRGEISFAPNLFSYNLVIDAWAKSRAPDAAFNAVNVLRKLISDPTTPEPDTFSFNQVLSALSKSLKPDAAQLADNLLTYMEESYQLKLYKQVKPDVIGYASVITALARSRDTPNGAERAEELLNRLKLRYAVIGGSNGGDRKQQQPNNISRVGLRICYNSLINGWATSGKGTFAARKAEALLQEMEELSVALQDDSISPNIITYNAVLNSWARSGTRCCGNKAELYLERMWELYHAGDRLVQPNDKTFNTVRG